MKHNLEIYLKENMSSAENQKGSLSKKKKRTNPDTPAADSLKS